MDAAIVPSTGVVDHVALQLWASGVGLGGEVEQLIAARTDLGAVLAEAQGKEIQNRALLLHLREAWQKASHAGDLMAELDHYRIQWETDRTGDDGDKVSRSVPPGLVRATQRFFSSEIFFSCYLYH
jgi:hypothetical protein